MCIIVLFHLLKNPCVGLLALTVYESEKREEALLVTVKTDDLDDRKVETIRLIRGVDNQDVAIQVQ